jgi:ketosteroid isomerase-like protein
MRSLMLMLAVALFLPPAAAAQADSGPAADVLAIHRLIHRYARTVHTVDPELLGRIWSHSPEVSFIYPLGEERGFEAIERNVFEKVLGGQFSARDLQMDEVAVHVNGNSAWSEFHWVFHATRRKDGKSVTTHGVETQIYRREAGEWRIVHVHYLEEGTEDRQLGRVKE